MVEIQKEDGGWVVTDVRLGERHGPYWSYTEAVKKAHECAPGWVYAGAEAQLALFDASKKVVIYLTIAETGASATLGARNGFAVSAIREAASLRDFILAQLDRHRFNGPRGDGDKHDENQIARVEFEEY